MPKGKKHYLSCFILVSYIFSLSGCAGIGWFLAGAGTAAAVVTLSDPGEKNTSEKTAEKTDEKTKTKVDK